MILRPSARWAVFLVLATLGPACTYDYSVFSGTDATTSIDVFEVATGVDGRSPDAAFDVPRDVPRDVPPALDADVAPPNDIVDTAPSDIVHDVPDATCGIIGSPCCAGSRCSTGTCVAGQCECGNVGEPCCPVGICYGSGHRCFGGTCAACGLVGEICCAGGSCTSGACVSGNCSCGGNGEPCCGTSSCDPGNVCSGGACTPCGSANLPCCDGNACDSASQCTSGTCEPCGAERQPCCSGVCGPGLLCETRVDLQQGCVACGDAGQPCCAGTAPCSAGLTNTNTTSTTCLCTTNVSNAVGGPCTPPPTGTPDPCAAGSFCRPSGWCYGCGRWDYFCCGNVSTGACDSGLTCRTIDTGLDWACEL